MVAICKEVWIKFAYKVRENEYHHKHESKKSHEEVSKQLFDKVSDSFWAVLIFYFMIKWDKVIIKTACNNGKNVVGK